MLKFTVEKSVSIAAPRGQVFALVRDFRKWEQWSPWLIAEPEVKPNYMENPDGYWWEGNITGAGEMLLEREVPGESIACKLTFLKPWKSICEEHSEERDRDHSECIDLADCLSEAFVNLRATVALGEIFEDREKNDGVGCV